MEDKVARIQKWLGQGSINIFGVPYAGKDTQGGVLADLLGAELMGGGQILRNSVIPDHVRELQNAGKLIPTEDYIKIVLPYLGKPEFADKPLILSSVGRWKGEEKGVLEATAAVNHPIQAVVFLEVSEDLARQRNAAFRDIDRGSRADDAPEVFTARLAEFREKTLPVINFYESQGLLVRVDGSLHPPEVTAQILEALDTLASTQSQ
jgi:adenylate kinase